MEPIFKRSTHNPIITARSVPYAAAAVLNPGVVEVDGEVVLLLRVEDPCGYSDIYVARSRNGATDWRFDAEPLLRHGEPDWKYELWGCEDPRVVYIREHDTHYITYTAYSPAGAAVGIASTRDFRTAERRGLIFSPNNKDAVLFPERFDGRFAVLHRPDAGGGIENIWLAYSPDLLHWGEPHCVLLEGHGPAWDAVKVGSGPPPIRTDQGWLLIYHGVKQYGGELVYRTGAALLDPQKPHRMIARAPHAVFKANALYEQSGLIPNVVFPTGTLLRGDELWMYYGACDSYVCLATARLDDLLATLRPDTKAEEIARRS